MKTFLRILSKKALLAGAVAVLAFFTLFLQHDVVRGKSSALHAATTTPLGGAKMTLTKVSSGASGQASLSTTTAPNGSFTFPAITTTGKGTSMITYTLTVTPATTYTVSDSKTGPKAIPNTSPVNVSITFNQQRGLTVGGSIANTGSIGPFTMSSSSSLQIGVGFGGAVSGTLSKQ